MPVPRVVVSLLLAGGLTAAGCSSDDDVETTPSAPPSGDASPVTADDGPEATVVTTSGSGAGGGRSATTGATNAAVTTTDDTPPPTPTATTVVPELPPAYVEHESELYGEADNWLCSPRLRPADDVCSRDLDATAVRADGTAEVIRHRPAADPAVDCFYVYPTVSTDPTANSDLVPKESDEIFVTLNHAGRLTASCRVFAPVYRQATLSLLAGGAEVPEGVDPREVAYADVLDAFRHYVANESDGRGFVLIGHSQGAGILRRLVAEEIDGEPALRQRLVSAMLLGTTVGVPPGEVTGGDFRNVPVCETPRQLGCVLSYSSYRDRAPPPADAFFGDPEEEGLEAVCTEPAVLGRERRALQPYFLARPVPGSLGALIEPYASGYDGDPITTPFVTFPDFVRGRCVTDGSFRYLELSVAGDPDDPRADDIGGDLTPQWGMHLVDVNVAMGDLVDAVAVQADAYVEG